MTLYLCRFIAVPERITLSEAVRWKAHGDVPLIFPPEEGDERNWALEDIYHSRQDMPAFVSLKQRNTRDALSDDKIMDALREYSHQDIVAQVPAQAELYQSLRNGTLSATGRLLCVLRPEYKGNTKAMSYEEMWVRVGQEQGSHEEKLLAEAKERFDEKPIPADFWEISGVRWEKDIAVSLGHGVLLMPLISTASLFECFPPKSTRHLEMQIKDGYCFVEDGQVPHKNPRPKSKSGRPISYDWEQIKAVVIKEYGAKTEPTMLSKIEKRIVAWLTKKELPIPSEARLRDKIKEFCQEANIPLRD